MMMRMSCDLWVLLVSTPEESHYSPNSCICRHHAKLTHSPGCCTQTGSHLWNSQWSRRHTERPLLSQHRPALSRSSPSSCSCCARARAPRRTSGKCLRWVHRERWRHRHMRLRAPARLHPRRSTSPSWPSPQARRPGQEEDFSPSRACRG